MRKRLILATVAVSVIACIVLATLTLLPPRPGVTKTNFDRIEIGMTFAEVDDVLGGKGLPFHGFANKQCLFVWADDDGSVAFIEFEKNSVTSKTWQPSTETFLAKLRRWLHLPK